MLNTKTYLLFALLWTAIVTFLSLATLGDVGESITIPGKDKYVHFTFYFVFVLFWNFVLKAKYNTVFTHILIVLFAIEYGVFMEICQGIFTKTRTPDIHDIYANTTGAIIGFIFITLYHIKKKATH